MEQQSVVVRSERYDMTQDAMTTDTVVRQVALIQDVMRKVMSEGEHYGKIPGCGDKPSLLKPGAEKLSLTFRLAPSYEIQQADLSGGHREYRIKCTLTHIPTGAIFGEGVGCCSTMEAKYRFRKAEQKCPQCGKEAIIRGKKEYGGGWLCFAKRGGCGAKFKDGDPTIENQSMGRIEHDNPADYFNTCLKMAKKRAHVDATLTATGASDIFTQDVEDMQELLAREERRAAPKPKPREEDAIDVVPSDYAPPDEEWAVPEQQPTHASTSQEIPLISEAQRKRLFAIARKAGWPNEEIRTYLEDQYGISHSNQIPRSKYEAICTWIESHTGYTREAA